MPENSDPLQGDGRVAVAPANTYLVRMVKSQSRDVSPDHEERILDFLARHGGRGRHPNTEGTSLGGAAGWFEVSAADGYRLRGEWSRMGDREEMRFTEMPP